MTLDWGDLVALASALGWAGTTVLARHIARSIPTIWYNGLRILIASGALIAASPWTLGRTDPSSISLTALALLLVSVLAGFAIGDTAFFEGIRRIGVARAAPIAGCHPLVTALLAVAFLDEPVTLILVVGVVVIGFGVWLITTDQAPAGPIRGAPQSMLLGTVLALVAAVGWAAASVLVRPALQEMDPIVASTIRLPFGAAVLLLLATRAGKIDSRRLELSRATIGWLHFAGLLTVLSATLFLWSVDLVGAARTAALSSISPIFSATIAVLFLGERLTARLAAGMGISLAGVLGILLGR